jgi:MFS family permease
MQMIGMLPMLFFIPFAKPITNKFGKKEASAFCSIFSIVACVLMNIVPMPANMVGVLIYVGLSFVHGVGLGCGMMMGNAMMADAIDYNEWKFGKREESITYAIHSFFRKLAQGVGPSIGLVLMVAVGYDEALGGGQPLNVATNLRYVMTGFTLFSSILNFIAFSYNHNLLFIEFSGHSDFSISFCAENTLYVCIASQRRIRTCIRAKQIINTFKYPRFSGVRSSLDNVQSICKVYNAIDLPGSGYT